MSTDERLARVALSAVVEPGHPVLARVDDLGAQVLLAELHAQASATSHRRTESDRQSAAGIPGDDLAQRLNDCDPELVLHRATRVGLRFVAPGDEEWPSSLDALGRAPEIQRRGGVPAGLWCRGPLRLDEACARAVAVVGSRSCTTYGSSIAVDLGADLAEAGWTTVSGAAFGIDQAAHRGALRAGGPTVAVLACGADRAYPLAHRDLIDHIATHGLVVSESAPGTSPTRIRFFSRNRLIAAMGGGTVVVEAGVRSGALNTGHWTAGLGRVLMGVPGPVTSAASAGVHQMIRNRDALLVTCGAEVLEAVAPMGSHQVVEQRAAETPRDRLTPVQREVLDAVPLVRAATATSIAQTAGVSPARVQQVLVDLHAAGLVAHESGRWRLDGPARTG